VRNPLKSLKQRPSTDLARRVYEEYGPELERFLGRRASSPEDARDLAQSVYLRLLQLPRDEVIRNPQGFMYRIARNVAHELRLRDRKNPVVYDSKLLDDASARTPDDSQGDLAHRMHFARETQRLLQSLPKNYQACLLLRKRHGLTPDEIAHELGLTKKTVQRYLIRAMAHFKSHFREP
jgi:RNA polymerase sigma-70 factor (ECF subfamily)